MNKRIKKKHFKKQINLLLDSIMTSVEECEGYDFSRDNIFVKEDTHQYYKTLINSTIPDCIVSDSHFNPDTNELTLDCQIPYKSILKYLSNKKDFHNE